MNKKTFNIPTTLLLFFALVAFKGSPAYALNFSDDFEAPSVNPFWKLTQQSCTIELSKDVSHSGTQSIKYSPKFGGDRLCLLESNSFSVMKQAEVAVWIYDTSPGEFTQYALMELWNTTTGQQVVIGIADNWPDNYIIQIPGGPQIPALNRTVGWHEFKVSFASGNLKFFIDGTEVGAFPNGFSMNQVLFGGFAPANDQDAIFYFDDFFLQSEPVSNVTCNGKVANIIGTGGPDILVGTGGSDVINGLNGNDGIDGRGGNDTICGGNGDDILLGGKGKNILLGGNGNDTLSGGPQEDVLNGGSGNDLLLGNLGNDILNGEAGNDQLLGGDGDDQLFGGTGADRLNGERGLYDICDGGRDTDIDTNLAGCDFLRNFP